jgi:hypothetical protein
MKFGPVPQIAEDQRPWATTRTIGPPPSRADIVGSLEAQVDEQTELGRAFRFFLELEPGDLEAIRAGHPVEFAVYAQQMVPVSVQVWR